MAPLDTLYPFVVTPEYIINSPLLIISIAFLLVVINNFSCYTIGFIAVIFNFPEVIKDFELLANMLEKALALSSELANTL